METAINEIKKAVQSETDASVRIGLKRALYILQDNYLKSLSPNKAIETIKQYQKEL